MRAIAHVGDEAGCRLDDAGCSYGDEHGRFTERLKNSIQMIRYLAEPADVRPNLPTAITARNVGRRIVGFRVFKRAPFAAIAPALKQLAMHMNRAPRTSLFVQAVHILRTEKQAVL